MAKGNGGEMLKAVLLGVLLLLVGWFTFFFIKEGVEFVIMWVFNTDNPFVVNLIAIFLIVMILLLFFRVSTRRILKRVGRLN